MACPVAQFVKRSYREFRRAAESAVWWKLNVIGRRRIESTIAADADQGTAVLAR